MKNIALGLLVTLTLGFTQAIANDNVFRSDHPEQYTVVKGDTLWDIAGKFLNNPWTWPEVWHVNPQIENPHLIYPGDIVHLTHINGKRRLTVGRGAINGTVKLSPKIRELPLASAIPAIPLEQINSFLSRNRVVDEGVLEDAPHVLMGQEKRLILGAGDRLYARGEFANNIPNYGVYRKGEAYIDPETKELLGVQAIDFGEGNMRALDDDVATLSVVRTSGEIRAGDRLLPNQERLINSTFFPSSPENDVKGVIMTVERGVTQVGMLDVVAINLGERESMKPGNVLAIFKRGEVIKDRFVDKTEADVVTLPEERAGLLMVFQTFDKMSLAIVLKADRGLTVNDIVRNP